MQKHAILALFICIPIFLWAHTLSDTARFDQTLCFYDSLEVNGTWYHSTNATGLETIPNGSFDGTDSIMLIDLSFYAPSVGTYRDTFCGSQTILLFGRLFSPAQPSAEIIYPMLGSTGCDSILNVELNFSTAHASEITDFICQGDTLMVNGTAYHRNFFIGEELIEMGAADGCDSLILINLQPLEYGISQITDTLYEDESTTVNGETIDIESQLSSIVLPNMAENGCDSILSIAITFIPRPNRFVFIPNVIQPSNENTTNTKLSFGLHPDVDFIEKMMIFDRWGSLLFQAKQGEAKEWDGIYKGKKALPETYIVHLDLVMKNGEKRDESGSFVLLR